MGDADLNLVRLFVAVYETGSVSAAASRLHVTQPSVSHGLARLRDILKSPLFTRTRQGMEPTATATELYPDLRQALSLAEGALATILKFDPASSRRCFRLALTDLGEIAFLPRIMNAMMRFAPRAELEVLPVDLETLEDLLARGRIDAAICAASPRLVRLQSVNLFEETYDCLYRSNHPRLRGKLSAAQYLGERHIMVAGSTGHDMVEAHLVGTGRHIDIGLRTTNLGAVGGLVATSDLVATVPSRIARLFAASEEVESVPLPFSLPPFEVRAYWWARGAISAELGWFRDMVIVSLEGT